MSADPRTEAAAKAFVRATGHKPGEHVNQAVAAILAAADAAALADELLIHWICAWMRRIYHDPYPTVGQVRMVLAALTALNNQETP